ncbi:MAG: hypothetical protein Ct9H300mP27_10030 [Chloroflexota bacterium]|nr:MAG: hypothetical protein Ct9H300mP27_10030 [Chloroflexota bacterium]
MAQNVGGAQFSCRIAGSLLGLLPCDSSYWSSGFYEPYRNHYQEVDHIQPFNAVTKYNAMVDSTEQLPLLLRQAFRTATSGPRAPFIWICRAVTVALSWM